MNAECKMLNAECRARRACASGIHHSSFIIHHFRRGFTLVEMLVVAGIIAILMTLAIASLKALTGGVQEGNGRTVLKTVLASARAEAASRGHVVGVRFEQYRYPPAYTSLPGVRIPRQAEDGTTFAVTVYPLANATWTATASPPSSVVMSEQALKNRLRPSLPWIDAYDTSSLFVAVPGRDPVRFPQGVELAAGTMDVSTDANGDLSLTTNLLNNTAFTVLFSPNGQVAIRQVAVIQRSNRDPVFFYPHPPAYVYPPAYARGNPAFLEEYDVSRPADIVPLLLSADTPYPPPAVGAAPATEISQNNVWLYDQTARKQAGAQPWTNYLKGRGKSVRIQINPYTGQLQEPSGG